MITQAELKERFNYDPETGIFTHKRSNPKSKMNGKYDFGELDHPLHLAIIKRQYLNKKKSN